MKIRTSVSAILVIIAAELTGLAGVVYLQRSHKHYSDAYEKIVAASSVEKDDISKIKQLIYEHEYYTSDYMGYSGKHKTSELKEKILQCEIRLRKQLFVHGDIMKGLKDIGKARLYRRVNDDVLEYLNYNAVLISMVEESSAADLKLYIKENVLPLIEQVNSSMEELAALADLQVENARKIMNKSSFRFRIVSFCCLAILVVSIIFSIIHSYRVMKNLEYERTVAEFKSDMSKELSNAKISNMQHSMLAGVAELIEDRSGETGEHVKRTSRYVKLLSEKALKNGLWPEIMTEEYVALLKDAAPLHDIGKISIPDSILNKPGKLTPEEFEVIKTHSVLGAKAADKILSGIADENYTKTVHNIALYHHEKWNGKGYPYGLKGEQIPLCARIMAVADVFDALVSERCYKLPMKFEDAVQLIKSEAGQHFDPKIVELFLELKDEFNDKK